MSGPERITLAMTGASGAQYGLRLLDCLVQEDREVHFLISKAAQLVMATETDVTLPAKPQMMQAFLTEWSHHLWRLRPPRDRGNDRGIRELVAIRPAGRELHLRVQQRKDALCQRHACQHSRCLRMDHGFGPRIPGYDSFGRYIATADIFLKPARELTVHSEHL